MASLRFVELTLFSFVPYVDSIVPDIGIGLAKLSNFGVEVCTHARGTMLHDVIYTGYVVIHASPDMTYCPRSVIGYLACHA